MRLRLRTCKRSTFFNLDLRSKTDRYESRSKVASFFGGRNLYFQKTNLLEWVASVGAGPATLAFPVLAGLAGGG